MQTLLRLSAYLKPYRKEAFVNYFCLLATLGLTLIVPQLIRQAIDQGLTGGDRQFFINSALLILGLALIRGLLGFWLRYLTEWLAQCIAYDLRNQLYDKYQTLSFTFHDHAHTGDLMSRATSDTDQVVRFIGSGLADLAQIAILLVGSLAIMFGASPRLTVLALLPIPVLIAVTFRFGFGQRMLSKRAQDQMGVLSTTLQENLTGVRVVKAFAREALTSSTFRTGCTWDTAWRSRAPGPVRSRS